MKNGQVIKSAPGDIPEELSLINQYARRELTEDEVYIFSVALCDNDIDRDNERFTVEALFGLEKLFVGKTGIVDHDPSAKNQKARIISCRVEAVEGCTTALGDQLFRLTARAYIVRTEGNKELIQAIEAGIVKEVSVGCSMGQTLCSVCRSDMRSPTCHHVKGRSYDGELCYGELCEPKDAYEFSFVAIPAQREAGVIKHAKKERDMKEIEKALETEQELTLNKSDVKQLREYINSLKTEAKDAEAYRTDLSDKLRKAAKQLGIELDYALAGDIIGKLDTAQMKALIGAMNKRHSEAVPQLYREKAEDNIGNTQFTI